MLGTVALQTLARSTARQPLSRIATATRNLTTSRPLAPRQTARMTTGEFRYLDATTIVDSAEPFVKPWSKVDVDYTSFKRTDRKRSVTNIRDVFASSNSRADFGTDISGFAFYDAPAKEKDFVDDAAIRGGYYAEVEALLRAKLPGVKKVVIFDHTIRARDRNSPRQPVKSVHVDQTPKAAEARLRRHVADAAEADELVKGRYQIINVWRPIGHAASDFPLALVDYRTTKPKDLVKVDLLYPKPTEGYDGDDRGREVRPDEETLASTDGYEVRGETFNVAPSEGHKFYYMKDMTPDEAVFIKCFDSRSELHEGGVQGLAGYTPHTAFEDPATPPDAPGRKSIEVRCLVFYE